MKKFRGMIAVILVMLAFVSASGADDKNYVVKETFTFTLVANPNNGGEPWGPWGSSTGKVFC